MMSGKISDRIRSAFMSMTVCGCHRDKDAPGTLTRANRPIQRNSTKDNFDIIISADEKLRSLGHKSHHQPLPKSSTYCGPQNPTPDSTSSSNRTTAPDVAPPPIPNQSDANRTDPKDLPPLDVPPPLFPKPHFLSQMAERRIQRGQRDGQRNDENPAKRRSRSAGPQNRRRVRNSMHETPSAKMQQAKQAANGRHSMYAEHISDDDILISGSESADSDEMMQQWTKNPLMVKKSRKVEKNSKTDKRKSLQNAENTENGYGHSSRERPLSQQRADSRELFIYPRKADSSPSSSHKAKFQRMEENRKKRIDMAVTSDEECSPELRINRLRQRAMMSSKIFSDDMNPQILNPGRDEEYYYQGNGYMPHELSDQPQRQSQYDEIRNSKYDENYNIGNVNENYLSNFARNQGAKQTTKLPNVLPEYLPQNVGKQQNVQKTQQQNDGYNRNRNDLNKTESYNQGRDNAVAKPQAAAKSAGNQGKVQPARVKLASESPKLRSFNEVRTSQPKPLKQAVEKLELNLRSPNSSSEDSLDELIESNIQYLESEIESGKLKRQSGNFSNVAPVKTAQDSYITPSPVKTAKQVVREPVKVKQNVKTHRNEIRNRLMPIEYSHEPSAVVKETVPEYSPKPHNVNDISATSDPNISQVADHRNIGAYGSATYSPYMQRKNVNDYNGDDMSKSDSQLNTVDSRFIAPQNYFAQERGHVPYPVLNKQTGNIMYVQPGNTEAEPLSGNLSSSLPASMDTGMFSDVDYDIEVAERIKKWEKKLDRIPGQVDERKILNTIQEYESMSDSNQTEKVAKETPLEIRRELRQLVSPTDNSGVGKLSVCLTRSSSSLTDSKPVDRPYYQPKVVSSETNLHRIFRVVQEPQVKVTKPVQKASVSVERPRKASADYVVPSSYAQSTGALSESELGAGNQQWPPMVDSDSGIRKSWRLSRYEDELNELKEIVSDNFRDIKKRFDSDMSETDTRRASSPVQTTPQIVQTTQFVQTTPQFVQTTPQFVQTTPQFVQSTPQFVQPTPQFVQNTPQFVQNTPHYVQPTQPKVTVIPQKSRSTSNVPVTLNIQTANRSPVIVRRMAPAQSQSQPQPKAQPEFATQYTQQYVQPRMPSKPTTPPVSPNPPPVMPKTEKKIPVFKNIPIETKSQAAPVIEQTPDVWSPNMESSKGLVSIERVKARTLQTIPFSEDPVWKEIEELTQFDKTVAPDGKIDFEEIDALLKLASRRAEEKSLKTSNLNSDTVMSSSFVQPTYSQQGLNVPIDRQRKMSDSVIVMSSTKRPAFTPPTIQPLKLSVGQENQTEPGHTPQSSSSALDEVLEDIRASLQKKPLSPKLLKNIDISDSNSSTNVQSPLAKTSKPFVFPKVEKAIAPQAQSQAQSATKTALTPGYDNWQPGVSGVPAAAPASAPAPAPAPSQPAKLPQTVAQQIANVPYIDPEFTQYPYIINGNYHLDPSLLSEKLKSTGLVNDSSDEQSQRRAMNPFLQNQPTSQGMVPSHMTQSAVPVAQAGAPSQPSYQNKPQARELDKSVDDLKTLAQEVENKLSRIKSKIVAADGGKLDTILLALRKFAPMTEQKFFNVKFTPNYENEKARRDKLENALYELDKMYDSLDLDDKNLLDRASRIEETQRPQARANKVTTKTLTITPAYESGSVSDSVHTRPYRKSQIEEVERQTQNEFEDITKSFTVLLDEVTRQCRTVAQGSSKYDRDLPTYRPTANVQYSKQPAPVDVITQERSQLKYETPSQRAVQDSYNTAIKELESVATGSFGLPPGKKPAVQTSVYLNLDPGKPKNEKANQNIQNTDKATSARSLDIKVQSKPIPQNSSQSKFTVVPTQFISMATEFKPQLAKAARRETSSSEDNMQSVSVSCQAEPKINSKTRSGRFRKRGNIEHRKSMPAIMRTVETQTVETQTDPVVSDKEKDDILRKFSIPDFSSDSSPDTKGFPVKRKLSTGIAKFVDMFDSSEDEQGREVRKKDPKLRHSLSAPDIVALFDFKDPNLVKVDKAFAKSAVKSATPRSVKHRSEAKSRFRSLQKDDVSLKKLEMAAAASPLMSSVTSEDGVDTPTTKPPVYPVWKYPGQGETPSPKKSEKRQAFAFDKDPFRIHSDIEQERNRPRDVTSTAQVDSLVVRRRTRSVGSEETVERPKSFHELLATFEQNPKRLERFRESALRKCASEDSVYTDLILHKIYHSDSDVSVDPSTVKTRSRSGSESGLKLKLEMEVKKGAK